MTERITDERLASLFKDAEQCGIFPAVKVNPRELSSVLAELAEFRDREVATEYVRASKERNPDVHEDGLRDDDGKVTRHIGYSDLSMRALADETGLEWVVRPVWHGPWEAVTGDDD